MNTTKSETAAATRPIPPPPTITRKVEVPDPRFLELWAKEERRTLTQEEKEELDRMWAEREEEGNRLSAFEVDALGRGAGRGPDRAVPRVGKLPRMKTAKALVLVALIVAGLIGMVWFNFYVWRLKHPTAPAWTIFFGR